VSGRPTAFQLPLDVSWELDVWGRVRRSVESSEASAQAFAADLETVRLSLQAELAINYFLLRGIDSERQLLDNTLVAYSKALELTVNRHEGGASSDVDVAQAETQLKTAQAQAVNLRIQRAQLEHAIAVLIGKAPAEFSMPQAGLDALPPVVPLVMPSELLERRPDIASAERQMASANAQIGVAKAAFYPTISIGASAGFASSKASNWLDWPSRFWSIGPAAALTLFDGGRRSAVSDQAQAAYDGTVAAYRQTVLTAFRMWRITCRNSQSSPKKRRSRTGGEGSEAVGRADHEPLRSRCGELPGGRHRADLCARQRTRRCRHFTPAHDSQRQVGQGMGGDWNVADLPAGDAGVADAKTQTAKQSASPPKTN
jgi:NodT family efflux transporter outer membrane factor (OMF) lipoprotein